MKERTPLGTTRRLQKKDNDQRCRVSLPRSINLIDDKWTDAATGKELTAEQTVEAKRQAKLFIQRLQNVGAYKQAEDSEDKHSTIRDKWNNLSRAAKRSIITAPFGALAGALYYGIMSDKNKARNALLGSLAVGGLSAGGVYAQEKLKDAIMSLIFEDINKGYKTSWFERNFGTGEHKGITTKDK